MEQELDEEESNHSLKMNLLVVQVIVQLGNDILKNLGVEEPIDDVAVFFRYPSLSSNSLAMSFIFSSSRQPSLK